MITTDHGPGLVSVTVMGEFSLPDYREFESLVNYKIRFEGPVSLLFDLRAMTGFTIDVALEDLKFSRAHEQDFVRIAILTDSQWISWSTWLSAIFVDSEVRAFEDEAEARAWLAETAETAQ